MESVKPPGIGNELRSLPLKHLPDCLIRELGMVVSLGVSDTSVGQPDVQFVEVLESKPRREEPLANQTDLVLDLSLLPARRRRAGNRFNQVTAAHLQEAAIVAPVPADEDRLDRGLHVVVDAAPAGALEQGERPIVGVEHHLARTNSMRLWQSRT